MARIRLNLRNLSIPAKIAKGRQIVTALTDNKNFPNPTPPLNDVTAAVEGLEQASSQVQSARAEVTTRTATQDNAESTKTISGLKSGTRFWFRVAAVGAGGQSGWSEHATKVAP